MLFVADGSSAGRDTQESARTSMRWPTISLRYGDLLTGRYDCVVGSCWTCSTCSGSAGRVARVVAALADDSDQELDTPILRLADSRAPGQSWGAANDVPVIFCKAGERSTASPSSIWRHEVGIGVLVLAAKAPAPAWKAERSAAGPIRTSRGGARTSTTSVPHHTWLHASRRRGTAVRRTGHADGLDVAWQAEAAGTAFSRSATVSPWSPTRWAWLGSQSLVAGSGWRAAEPGPPALIYSASVLRILPRRAATQRA